MSKMKTVLGSLVFSTLVVISVGCNSDTDGGMNRSSGTMNGSDSMNSANRPGNMNGSGTAGGGPGNPANDVNRGTGATEGAGGGASH